MQLAVDHDHKTGAVRALLCASCNNGLGDFRDNITYLQAAIDYLKKHVRHDDNVVPLIAPKKET